MGNADGTKNANGRNVLLSSDGMHEMAASVLEKLKLKSNEFEHVQVECDVFKNGELKPHVLRTVRKEHVYFFHPLQHPDPNTALVNMLLTNDALRRASVAGITLVLPYMSYLRQDRKDEPRVPISAKAIANLIESNRSVEQIITFDMHTDQAQGFFNIGVDNIYGAVVHAEHFRNVFNNNFTNVLVVAPDVGAGPRARRFALKLGESVPVSIVDKRRTGPNKSEVLNFIGKSPVGMDVILYDDMIDTGGTNRGTMEEVMSLGARSIYSCVTHGIFSEESEKHFKTFGQKVVILNTIPRSLEFRSEHESWLTFVSIDDRLAQAIYQASIVGGSVSEVSG